MYCFVLHIGIYINSVQIAKRHTSPVLAFIMQTRLNILSDLVLHVESKNRTYSSLCCFVQYRYIPIFNTKQYMYKTNYALIHHSRTYNKVYIGIVNTVIYVIRSFEWKAFNKPGYLSR